MGTGGARYLVQDHMKRHVTGLALIAMLLAACGATGGAATTVASTTDTSLTETTLPAAEDVVLVVEDIGGFVPIEFALGRGPRYVLTVTAGSSSKAP